MDPRERRQHQLFGMVDTRRTDLLRLYRHLTGSKPPAGMPIPQVIQVIVDREFQRRELYGATG
jgi:hypothetical protein